jgi:hypothetical protein
MMNGISRGAVVVGVMFHILGAWRTKSREQGAVSP